MAEDEQDQLIRHLQTDYTQAGLPAADLAMLAYAYKLTVTPAKITATDVQDLRQAGFNDRAIHDICAVTAYFAFVNRIADGLGVELEG
ncbi:MAG: hypothetical protein QNJ45_26415 [Ardenticatenaceae bacterium]|nr:hypothetical protein [Ardenticatenaceae bacterium]